MKEYKFTPEFEIGQKVYHATPDSDQGIIVDISYSILSRSVRYEVVFGRRGEDDIWCHGHELSENKTF